MSIKKNTVILFFFIFPLLGMVFFSFSLTPKHLVNKNEKILDVLVKLGDTPPLHYIPFNELSQEKITQGFEIVTKGYTTYQNKQSKLQSKHFVCTDCHNIKIEDPDLTKSNPETRLDYAVKNNLKFLQGTTLAGVVNREKWYNGDYLKKYGNLVKPARDTLVNAIHLCAVECSQGRELEKWEMEAVTHYFLTIGFELKDLNFSTSEIKQITTALHNGTNKQETIALIKSKYLSYSPATFLDPIYKTERKLGTNGNWEKGKQLFELSCLTCHKEKGVTNYKLNSNTLTFKHLKYWSDKDSKFSVYNITRKGTYALNGYKPYMPNYTLERLSQQQLEDLLSYINKMSSAN